MERILKVILAGSGFIFIMTFELFPHGNNCISHRQENRSAASKQDTMDMIHFEHHFEPTN